MSIETNVSINLQKDVFERLQSLAEPLVDDPNSVIQRLINHWQTSPPREREQGKPPFEYWLSARGEKLPVGLELRAKYDGSTYKAKVMKQGIFIESETFGLSSPSAAAIHAKKIAGLTGASANTNGWRFWEYLDSETGDWKSLEDFRKQK